ncbi:hypothetical protein [Paraglaciecola hydrolytica]|uniref:Thioesterase n=1 Tax=Paraglaciecola hydrolytica TaxID=1799789 RepID=A0A136A4L5_9ALTE|nr:hypothetical protein [Paraglaciecola hydrolytica]KXI30188.1 hypothetical protein AX660_09360 [Paraglaciecola hydrolytica]
MNPVKSITKSTDSHPIASFFSVRTSIDTPEKVMLELTFLPKLTACQSRPISMLGLIVDHIATLVGKKSLGECMPVELELLVHGDIWPKQLKVIANIELARHGHALFNCQVYATQNHTQELLASSHGTLITCPKNGFLLGLDKVS